jgi:subtilisin family serine protease
MNNYKKTSKWMSIAVFSALSIHSIAQSSHKESVPLPTNAALELQWQHADITNDGLVGVSATKTYNELVKGKTPTPVVVAVIDSGTETFHPDLKANIWVNADEIAGNGIDDDKNGYIDDVHGWSFIGGKNGDVSADNLEFTRVYKVLKAKYENKSADAIAKSDKKEYRSTSSSKTTTKSVLKKLNKVNSNTLNSSNSTNWLTKWQKPNWAKTPTH